MKISHLRTYEAFKTTGLVIVAGATLGPTIEDIGRPAGIKIPKETCIPEGTYFARITMSARFGRAMIQLFTDKTSLACNLEGITFTGVRVHRGITTADTEGCVLYRGNLTALEAQIQAAQDRNEEVLWEITRDNPAVRLAA